MISEIVSVILTFALAALPLLFPNRSPQFYALIILSAMVAYLAFWCIRLGQKARKLTNELNEAKKKHKELSEKNTALSSSFYKKRDELNQYRAGFSSIEYMIANTMNSSRKDRFASFYQWFLDLKVRLEKNK